MADRYSELAGKLKPYMSPWIEAALSGVGGGSGGGGVSSGAPSPHLLDSGHHAGLLPWADVDKAGSSLADLATANHSDLGGMTDSDHHDPVTVNAPLAKSGQNLSLGVGAGLTTSGSDLVVDEGYGFTWTAAQAFQNNVTSRLIKPEATDTYDLGTELLLFRQIFASQINAVIFAEETQQLYGGWLTVGHNAGSLGGDVGTSDTTVDFGKTMTVNDFIVIRAHDTGGAIKAEYMQVGSLVSGTTYNVTRDLAAAHGTDPAWAAGTPFLVLGNSGDGRIELSAYSTPRMSIVKQGASYNAQTEIARFGDIDGLGGISGETYGVFIGDSSHSLLFDGTNFDLADVDISMSTGGTDFLLLNPTNGVELLAATAWARDRAVTFFDSSNNELGGLYGFDSLDTVNVSVRAIGKSGKDAVAYVRASAVSGQDSAAYLYAGSAATNEAYVLAEKDSSHNTTVEIVSDVIDVTGDGIVDGEWLVSDTLGGLGVGTSLSANYAISMLDSGLGDPESWPIFLFGKSESDRNAAEVTFRYEGDNDATSYISFGFYGNNEGLRVYAGKYMAHFGTIYPDPDDTHDLGGASNRYDDVYATNGTIQTSDERRKLEMVDSDLGLDFVKAMRPVRYKRRSAGRPHYGLPAQHVRRVMDEQGIEDFAGFIHNEEADMFGLRYQEFIAPMISAIQQMARRLERLEERGGVTEQNRRNM